MSKLWMNMALVNELGVNVLGREKFVSIKDHADGLVGVLMVFDNYEEAQKYDLTRKVVELEALEPDTNSQIEGGKEK